VFDGRNGRHDTDMGLITIKRTRRTFAVTAVSLAILVAAALTIMVYPSSFYSFTCGLFDLPEYEKQYGFTYSEVPAMRPDGSTRIVGAISAVDPNGAFARSGIRAGDVPRTHHGLGDFCACIVYAEEGGTIPMEVFNVYDEKAGREPRRQVVLQLRQ
jgi:hypothetical protein